MHDNEQALHYAMMEVAAFMASGAMVEDVSIYKLGGEENGTREVLIFQCRVSRPPQSVSV